MVETGSGNPRGTQEDLYQRRFPPSSPAAVNVAECKKPRNTGLISIDALDDAMIGGVETGNRDPKLEPCR